MRNRCSTVNSDWFQLLTELHILTQVVSVLMRSQCVQVCACMCECSMCHDVWMNAQVGLMWVHMSDVYIMC